MHKIGYTIARPHANRKRGPLLQTRKNFEMATAEPHTQGRPFWARGPGQPKHPFPGKPAPLSAALEGPRGHTSLSLKPEEPRPAPHHPHQPRAIAHSLSLSEPQSPLPKNGFIMTLFSLPWSLDCIRLQTEIGSGLTDNKKGLALCLEEARPAKFLNSRTMQSQPLSGGGGCYRRGA